MADIFDDVINLRFSGKSADVIMVIFHVAPQKHILVWKMFIFEVTVV